MESCGVMNHVLKRSRQSKSRDEPLEKEIERLNFRLSGIQNETLTDNQLVGKVFYQGQQMHSNGCLCITIPHDPYLTDLFTSFNEMLNLQGK
jgi:hypothetical protein